MTFVIARNSIYIINLAILTENTQKVCIINKTTFINDRLQYICNALFD